MMRAPDCLALLALLLAPASVLADTVYNCAGSDGREVLQNAPCQDSGLLWLKNARAAPTGGPAPPAEASPEPSLGMTTAQVRALLGAPTEISQEEVVDGHTLVWTYPGARAFQFDTSGILVGK